MCMIALLIVAFVFGYYPALIGPATLVLLGAIAGVVVVMAIGIAIADRCGWVITEDDGWP